MEMTIPEFIKLCHEIPEIPYDKSLEFINPDIRKKNQEGLGLPLKIKTEGVIIDELKRCVFPNEDEPYISRVDLEKFKHGLRYHKVIYEDPDSQLAIDLLDTLHGLLGNINNRFRPFDNPLWEKAIALLKGYLAYDKSLAQKMFPDKAEDRAKAAIKLRDYGVDVGMSGYEMTFEHEDLAFKMLDERVCKMGGRWWIERVFASLDYNADFDRLILPKQGNRPDILSKPSPDYPFNYMLNAGLRELKTAGESKYQNDRYFTDTVRLFSDICFAMFEVKSYSIWDNIFHVDKTPLKYMRDLIYRESIFDLHQSSSRFATRLLDWTAKYLKTEKLSRQVTDLVKFLKFLLKKAEPNYFVRLNLKEIGSRKSDILTKDELLGQTSIEAAELNRDFSSPADYTHVNFWNKPIVKISDDEYLLLPKTIAARCCIETFLDWMRIHDQNFDSFFGFMLEGFLKAEFSKKGIPVKSGKYEALISSNKTDGKKKGECDGLIESEKSIFLLEMKKKSLIRNSRSGSEFQLLLDLESSLVDSQVQGLRTQLALKNGPLKLIGDEGTFIIELKGRNVERLTVTLFPFGDIQDRILIAQVLDIMCRNKFEYCVDDESLLSPEEKQTFEKDAERLKRMSNKLDLLKKYFEMLNEKRPFFNSWFLDAEKTVWLLKDLNGVDEFEKYLLKFKNLSTGTFDFYNEQLYLNARQEGGAAGGDLAD